MPGVPFQQPSRQMIQAERSATTEIGAPCRCTRQGHSALPHSAATLWALLGPAPPFRGVGSFYCLLPHLYQSEPGDGGLALPTGLSPG